MQATSRAKKTRRCSATPQQRPARASCSPVSARTPNEELHETVARGRVVAESCNWARALADEPGASLPPREFARRAAEMAEEFGLKVETLTADEIQARGMGGLWGVGKGSDNRPALIVLRYEPEGASADDELW